MAGKFGGRTSATRPKGSGIPAGGVGHGKGKPPAPFTSEYQPPSEAKKAGHEVGAEIRAAIAAKRHEILNAQLTRALDPAHPQGHQASKDLLDRIMPPESKMEHSGAVGAFALSDEERRARMAELLAKREAAGGSDG